MAWLEDEPGFVSVMVGAGFFSFIMTATSIINILILKNIAFGWLALGTAVRPKASASVSKHCVPVHTVLRWSESRTSLMPGRCGAFWQTQLSKSSRLGIGAN